MPPFSRLGTAVALAAAMLALLAPPAAAHEKMHVVVVDQRHAQAADTNAGTSTAPLLTISAALDRADDLNRDGHAVRVNVRPGVYRESLRLPTATRRTAARLVLAGAGAAQVTVSGADIWQDWTAQGGGTFAHAWPHRWGLDELPDASWQAYFDDHEVTDLARRREVIWINGRRLRQVLLASELEPGTFHVDEGAQTVRLIPFRGVSMADARVEVAVRDQLLDVQGWSNLVVRGMTFRGAATHLERAAVRFLSTRNVTLRDARIVENNWTGLALQEVDGATIRRVSTSFNGVTGLSVYKSRNVGLFDVENSFNNTWRGRWSNYFGWATGAKLYKVRGAEIRRWRAVGNDANGLWLDTDVSDVTIRGSYMARNLRRGVFLEALQGPVFMAGNVICDNGEYGVVDGKADGVTLKRNRIFGNEGAQILFSGQRGGRSFTTFDTGEDIRVQSTNWTLRGNVVGGAGDARVVGNHLDDADWRVVRSSLELKSNRWHQPRDPQPFTLPGRVVPFSSWRSATGEQESTFAATRATLDCRAPRPKRAPR